MTIPQAPARRASRPSKPAPAPLGVAENLGLLIGRVRRLLWFAAARATDQRGQSIYDYQLLARLALEGPQSQRALALSTAQHPAAISRLLVDLQRRQLVRRRRDPADRRHSIVTLTPRGRAAFQEARPQVQQATRQALAALSARDCQQLTGLLEKLVEHDFAKTSPAR
jgi:DNA-binding MarR family transcriptional regulator